MLANRFVVGKHFMLHFHQLKARPLKQSS